MQINAYCLLDMVFFFIFFYFFRWRLAPPFPRPLPPLPRPDMVSRKVNQQQLAIAIYIPINSEGRFALLHPLFGIYYL